MPTRAPVAVKIVKCVEKTAVVKGIEMDVSARCILHLLNSGREWHIGETCIAVTDTG
jgi:hypothetical protein